MKEEVFESRGLIHGSSAPALETFLRRKPGIHRAEASCMSESVTVGYDESRISEEQIQALIERCGYHCRGEVLPSHLTNVEARTGDSEAGADAHPGQLAPPIHGAHQEQPQARPGPFVTAPSDGREADGAATHGGHVAGAPTLPSTEMAQMAHAMGHGGGMDMEDMVRDMRRRFLVAFVLAIPVFLYSPLATDTFSLDVPTPGRVFHADQNRPRLRTTPTLRRPACDDRRQRSSCLRRIQA